MKKQTLKEELRKKSLAGMAKHVEPKKDDDDDDDDHKQTGSRCQNLTLAAHKNTLQVWL